MLKAAGYLTLAEGFLKGRCEEELSSGCQLAYYKGLYLLSLYPGSFSKLSFYPHGIVEL
jgi:hypothetical protein